MRTDAYRLVDAESATGRFPSSEVTRHINQGVAFVWDVLANARGFSYYGKPYYVMSGTTTSSRAVSMTRTGSAGAIWLTGHPVLGTNSTFYLQIEILVGGTLGTAVFRWADGSFTGAPTTTPADEGTLFPSGTSTTGGRIALVDASGLLPGTGLTATFIADTYVQGDVFSSVASRPTTTADTGTYALPSDFLKMHSVKLVSSGDAVTTLEPLNALDEGMLRDTIVEGTGGAPVYYQIRDGYLDLLPVPQDTYTIELDYVPTAPTLRTDTDAFDGIAGYEDVVALYAGRRMALKNEDFELARELKSDLVEWERRLMQHGTTRDAGRPERVQDVRAMRVWSNRRRWR
jgi:hypothetical protein